MTRWIPKSIFAAFIAACVMAIHPASGNEALTDGMAAAARTFLTGIAPRTDEASFAFTDEERFDWHYTPRSRDGINVKDLIPRQRDDLKELMRSTLSAQGILKAEAIMALEGILADIEGSSRSFRDPEKYFVSVFGTPGEYPWGWRFEGHHLSINVTVPAAGEVSVTPTFLGSNPARVPSGPHKGKFVQYDEFILAVRLARSMKPEHMQQALLSDRALGNIVTNPGRGDALETPEGLPVTELSSAQRNVLTQLIAAYVGMARDEIGRPYMQLVEDGWAETRFAWAGPVSEVEPFYYRIHGPRILIEFDNTQGGGNHIHSVWRDPLNDFGRDDLHRHYRDAPVAHGHRP
ncbi:MAG: DUF3500 domain-containing protein [Rhodospirillales bacterium]|nr:DUF3500 domain-containing protein [Rhodospirillales bacterium]MBO6788202.1 DUF3500 domain-containing protein [Rhodospirillales bacterium]